MKGKLVWHAVSKWVVDNLPAILSGAACCGLIGSVAMAIIDTPKAQEKIVEAKLDKAEEIERNAETNEELDIYRDGNDGPLSLDKIKLTPWEYAKILVPVYWKTGVCVILTGTCIIMSNRISAKRAAMLLAALKLKDKEFKEYQDKVKEMFGSKKEEEIEQEIAKDISSNVPDDGIYETGFGRQIFYEPIMQRYFRSSLDRVKNAWVDFKEQVYDHHEGSLTDLYYAYNVPLMDTFYPDRILWTHEEGDPNILGMVQFNFGTYDRTGEHVAVISYPTRPDLG